MQSSVASNIAAVSSNAGSPTNEHIHLVEHMLILAKGIGINLALYQDQNPDIDDLIKNLVNAVAGEITQTMKAFSEGGEHRELASMKMMLDKDAWSESIVHFECDGCHTNQYAYRENDNTVTGLCGSCGQPYDHT